MNIKISRFSENLSNTLISSDGYDGEIILTTKMNSVTIEDTKVIADAGCQRSQVSPNYL